MKFAAEEFQPTKWDTAADKARFANHFAKFVEGDFREDQFPEWFYQRLSKCFGHIANYNRGGFFAVFFTTEEGKFRFLQMSVENGCYGDPTFTYSDVERALRAWILATGLVDAQRAKVNTETETRERAQLRDLLAKYPDEVRQ